MDAAPAPGVTADRLRPTVVPRPLVTPLLLAGDPDGEPGHAPDEAAVRRFWTAVIGPGAVADLLRLVAAAAAGRRLLEPRHLAQLAAEGLCIRSGRVVAVRRRIPRLGRRHLSRLTPRLRAEYRRLLEVS
jgi:hypothetical protein